MNSPIGIGVIGYGYWGPNLARNIADAPGAALVGVSDTRPARLAAARSRYPGISATGDCRALLDDPRVDAVAIATPVSTHFLLALEALRAGKHVLVEKPLADRSEHAERLIEEAERRGLVLMVDHTFVYTGAVRKIRDLVASGAIGDVYYYDSVRVNLGLFQHDVNVIWDLAVHDLSIMAHVLPSPPRAVSAVGMSHIPGEPENIAYLTLRFDSHVIAHLHVNWLAPVKVRRTLVSGSRKMIVYDDLEPSDQVKVYDSGVTLESGGEGAYQLMLGYRTGDMWAPRLDRTEALALEIRHFVECMATGAQPVTGGEAGLAVVRILEAADESLARGGAPVALAPAMAVTTR